MLRTTIGSARPPCTTTRCCGSPARDRAQSNRSIVEPLLLRLLDETLRSHSAPAVVTVDMASLRFLDVAGAVSFIHAAEGYPSTYRLVLRGVRPRVQRVLERCGAQFASPLVVAGASSSASEVRTVPPLAE